MIKGFRQIASLTVVSRILGMFRDVAFSHYFGAGWLMTAWTMGFKVPNLARRLFGEGAAAASFIPIYREVLHKDPESARRLANTVITAVFIFLAGIVIIGEVVVWGYYSFFSESVGSDLGLGLCGIMLPYMILICLVAILAGVLNVHGHFAAPAAAPIILNVFIISGVVITGKYLGMEAKRQVFYVAGAVLLAGIAQISAQLWALKAKNISIGIGWEVHSAAFKKILFLMGPMILGLTVTQINTLADDLVALGFSYLRDDYSSVPYLYYAQRLYQFPLGVLGISLATAIFPVMAADAARKDSVSLCRTINKGLRGAVFVAVPATAGIFIVSRPLVSVIFEHGKFTAENSYVTAITLGFYAVGLCGYFCQQIATRAFYSLQDSKLPAKTAVVAVVVNIVLNLLLIWPMGTAGLALSTAICSYLQVVILVGVLGKRFGREVYDNVWGTIGKTLAATGVMSIIGLGIMWSMSGLDYRRSYDIGRLAAIVSVCGGTYFVMSKLLSHDMLGLITGKEAANSGKAGD
ncbi:MAG: murein biosynthesis integral membrane protein MurJ [Phycisphaerae bacterium]|nr:murein biosynthesis integral membrane protein MurJ [Phycisphaerae bacterium]